MTYFDIKGWGTLPEIYPYAAFYVGNNSEIAKFVEVGVAYGRSIAYLADQIKLANRENNVELYAVDMWSGKDQYNIFSANMNACQIRHMIKPIRTYSHMASLGFPDRSVNFVYIDGSHKFEDVKLDILSWLPKVKPGGILAGHDLGAQQCQGVQKAVDEIIGKEQYDVWGRSWVYQVKRD